ncbi:MAG: hypothetical protein AAGG45_04665 [Pseudomonadota bacterium]
MKKVLVALGVSALVFGGMASVGHAQEGAKKETEKAKESKEKKEESKEERAKRRKAVVDAEREKVSELIKPTTPGLGGLPQPELPDPTEDSAEGEELVSDRAFRRSTDVLIADMIRPFDKCQKNPTDSAVRDAYKKAFNDLEAKTKYLERQLEGDERQLLESEIKELEADLARLKRFREAMPKPGYCYKYHSV